jgi:hypothetical protein
LELTFFDQKNLNLIFFVFKEKALFNYIINEYISMWLHENLRIIQEDFSIIIENGTKKNFFLLCICLFQKLESICAINWVKIIFEIYFQSKIFIF